MGAKGGQICCGFEKEHSQRQLNDIDDNRIQYLQYLLHLSMQFLHRLHAVARLWPKAIWAGSSRRSLAPTEVKGASIIAWITILRVTCPKHPETPDAGSNGNREQLHRTLEKRAMSLT
ncbi:hypothetical protein AAMO2058_001703600 [Amorphochlora amoebiformis]